MAFVVITKVAQCSLEHWFTSTWSWRCQKHEMVVRVCVQVDVAYQEVDEGKEVSRVEDGSRSMREPKGR